MPQHMHRDVALNGLSEVVASCNAKVAVLAYTPGEPYATTMAAGNVVAQAPMIPADFTVSPEALGPFVLTDTSKVATATTAGNATHLVHVDTTTSRVLLARDETGAVVAVPGGDLRLPATTTTFQAG